MSHYTSQPCPEIRDARWVIQGITAEGELFRPSDWAQRLAGVAGEVGRDHRIRFHPLVGPARVGEGNALVMRCGIEQQAPELFAYLMAFAHSNRLTVKECGCAAGGGDGEVAREAH